MKEHDLKVRQLKHQANELMNAIHSEDWEKMRYLLEGMLLMRENILLSKGASDAIRSSYQNYREQVVSIERPKTKV